MKSRTYGSADISNLKANISTTNVSRIMISEENAYEQCSATIVAKNSINTDHLLFQEWFLHNLFWFVASDLDIYFSGLANVHSEWSRVLQHPSSDALYLRFFQMYFPRKFTLMACGKDLVQQLEYVRNIHHEKSFVGFGIGRAYDESVEAKTNLQNIATLQGKIKDIETNFKLSFLRGDGSLKTVLSTMRASAIATKKSKKKKKKKSQSRRNVRKKTKSWKSAKSQSSQLEVLKSSMENLTVISSINANKNQKDQGINTWRELLWLQFTTGRKCLQCGEFFTMQSNSENSCTYHSQGSGTYFDWEEDDFLDAKYMCCNVKKRSAPGCKSGRHNSEEGRLSAANKDKDWSSAHM